MEPYVVLTDNEDVVDETTTGVVYGKTLTFYYDKKKEERSGEDISVIASFVNKDNITKAVFDDSFANCATLTSTGFWFAGCYKLTSITGISNLKTDNVESMTYMFYMCRALTDVDVSHFNTANVTDMSNMFNDCYVTNLDV